MLEKTSQETKDCINYITDIFTNDMLSYLKFLTFVEHLDIQSKDCTASKTLLKIVTDFAKLIQASNVIT